MAAKITVRYWKDDTARDSYHTPYMRKWKVVAQLESGVDWRHDVSWTARRWTQEGVRKLADRWSKDLHKLVKDREPKYVD